MNCNCPSASLFLETLSLDKYEYILRAEAIGDLIVGWPVSSTVKIITKESICKDFSKCIVEECCISYYGYLNGELTRLFALGYELNCPKTDEIISHVIVLDTKKETPYLLI